MNKTIIFLRKNWLWLILVFAIIIRIAIAWAPIEWLFEQGIVGDDTFYYLTIAHNFANGHGLTFDKLAPTNGFHPFWMMLIWPIFLVFGGDKLTAVHVVLSLAAVIDVISILILYFVLRELQVTKVIRFFSCLFYALSPAVLFSAAGPMNGLETSLNVLMILLFILIYLKMSSRNIISIGAAALFGLVTGLLFLTRTDNTILILVVWIFLLLFRYRKNITSRFHLMLSGGIAAIIGIPWLAWSYSVFGSFVQVSGRAVPFMTHETLAKEGWTIINYFLQYLKNIGDTFIYLSGILVQSKFSWEFLLMATLTFLGLLSIGILFVRDRKSSAKERLTTQLKALAPFLVVPPVLLLAQTARAVFLRPWYHFSVIPILIIVVAVLLGYAWSFYRSSSWKTQFNFLGIIICAPLFLLALLYVFTVPQMIYATENISEDINKYNVIETMNRIIPAGSKVGVWNAGIIGYFFESGQVINLDGLVNNEAYDYIRNHNLSVYVKEKEISYLVDHISALKNNAPFWRMGLEGIGDEVSIIYIDRNISKDPIFIGKLL